MGRGGVVGRKPMYEDIRGVDRALVLMAVNSSMSSLESVEAPLDCRSGAEPTTGVLTRVKTGRNSKSIVIALVAAVGRRKLLEAMML